MGQELTRHAPCAGATTAGQYELSQEAMDDGKVSGLAIWSEGGGRGAVRHPGPSAASRGGQVSEPEGVCPASHPPRPALARDARVRARRPPSPAGTQQLRSSPCAQNMGIQKLLQAEQEASEVIAAAKAAKFNRLKQAKLEAEAEIAAYKTQREAQFQVFAKERMGDSTVHQKAVATSSESSRRCRARWQPTRRR